MTLKLVPLTALCVATLAASAVALDAADGNWPQWRGPEMTGVAPKGSPPLKWDPETNIKWKAEIPGRGSASPIVWDDRVFILTAVDTGKLPDDAVEQTAAQEPVDQPADSNPADRTGRFSDQSAPPEDAPERERRFRDREDRERGEGRGERGFGRGGPGGRGFGGFGRRDRGPRNIYQFKVICLDRNTGDVLWEKTAREAAPHEGMHDTNSYASGSPTTDGKFLYASFGSHGVYCYDLDGNLIWEKDLGDMETRNGFGEGASPTLHGDTLLVPWDHERESYLFALDAKTGEINWQVDRDEPTTWVTPLVVEAAGKTQVILNGTNRSRSYDINTGKLIWECGGQASNPIATAVVHDGLVYCMTGHRGSAVVAIPLDSAGDITDTDKIAWKSNQGAPYVPSPILYGDKLYFTKANNGVLSCLEAKTGEPLINQKRLPGVENVYASPVGADGRIYFTGRDGTTVVIPNTGELEILATNTVGEPVDASPAIVGNQIFIRGENHLFCIEE
jgi:outer membrane protein assembly factor BamB